MTQSSNAPKPSLPLDFLTRLGLARNCSVEEVRDAFLRRAQAAHPDHGGDKEAFQRLKRDYESALEYARRPSHSFSHTTSASPHQATVRVAVRKKRHRRPSRFVRLLLAVELLAVVGCFCAPSVVSFAMSVLLLCGATLLLAVFALPKMPRAYATIFFFCGVFMTATLMIGLTVQGEYSRVYKISWSEMDAYDWLMATSPFYFGLLWMGGFGGWSASWTRANN